MGPPLLHGIFGVTAAPASEWAATSGHWPSTHGPCVERPARQPPVFSYLHTHERGGGAGVKGIGGYSYFCSCLFFSLFLRTAPHTRSVTRHPKYTPKPRPSVTFRKNVRNPKHASEMHNQDPPSAPHSLLRLHCVFSSCVMSHTRE